ncbi:hypothetical protein SKAU_G00258780 [Synaphobranchus kaupii]|uniref:Uncharacterized protein n=1 Tax=Synaphobranchus kaupii TaxID=118154 RepID=A0A9Q1F4B0_SYNKA|nr:hypothetical protein SKAU_G00258780 [Synaphobranchus kaupii]
MKVFGPRSFPTQTGSLRPKSRRKANFTERAVIGGTRASASCVQSIPELPVGGAQPGGVSSVEREKPSLLLYVLSEAYCSPLAGRTANSPPLTGIAMRWTDRFHHSPRRTGPGDDSAGPVDEPRNSEFL